jgi:hypothetical protein
MGWLGSGCRGKLAICLCVPRQSAPSRASMSPRKPFLPPTPTQPVDSSTQSVYAPRWGRSAAEAFARRILELAADRPQPPVSREAHTELAADRPQPPVSSEAHTELAADRPQPPVRHAGRGSLDPAQRGDRSPRAARRSAAGAHGPTIDSKRVADARCGKETHGRILGEVLRPAPSRDLSRL